MAELLHEILWVSNVAGLATRELLLGTLDESAPPMVRSRLHRNIGKQGNQLIRRKCKKPGKGA